MATPGGGNLDRITDELLCAADLLDRANRSYLLARTQHDEERQSACEEVVNGLADREWEIFVENLQDDEDWVFEACDYLFDGSDTYELPTALMTRLDSLKPDVSALTVASETALAEKRGEVRARQHSFVEALQFWSRSAEPAGWPEVLAAWRRAVSISTRQAADVLGVSASAVTRYESGARSPSLPQLRGMVNAIAAWDLDASPEVDLVLKASRVLQTPVETVVSWLEKPARERQSLLEELEEGLDEGRLAVEELAVLVELARSPALLREFSALSHRLASAAAGDTR